MKNALLKLIACFSFLFLSIDISAQLSLPAIFSDHMVLQREKPIAVWGTARPGEKITITFANQKTTAKTAKDGKWKATLKAMPAGGPYSMSIKSGKEEIKFSDILMGEVWICSGQSNMEWRVNATDNAPFEIASAKYPDIRSLNVEKAMSHTPMSDFTGHWEICSPATAGNFSAVGYYFARELYKNLNIPIGFVNTSWGGTDIETWMSMEAVDNFPKYAELQKKMRSPEFEASIKNTEKAKAEFENAMANEPGIKEQWFADSYSKNNWKEYEVPTLWNGDELGDLDGIVWFTYNFTIPANCLGKEAILNLGPIDDNDVTWVNGREIGQTIGHNIKRTYTIPASVLKEKNSITIKITDNIGGGGLYGNAEDLFIQIGEEIFPLAGTWKYKVAVSNKMYDFIEFGPNAYPSLLYNAMVNPMIGIGMRGVIWYQGENNANRYNEYYKLFPAMINDWRGKWNDEFPFYWVQLANFMAPDDKPFNSDWANLRNAQSATLSLPKTGQAVIIDIGDANDIHPRNKQDVGKRLAYNALYKDYGFTNIAYSGPVYKSMEKSGSNLIITFDPMAEKLVVRNKYGYLSGFAIAGTDGQYYWAQAKADGNKVILSSDLVKNPVSVRYAWGNNPDDANLYNSAGLPASPFEAKVE